MTKDEVQITIGGLIHDIGKAVDPDRSGMGHGASGYTFLKEEAHIEEERILEPVHFHHKAELEHADLPCHSFAYLMYFADQAASLAEDRGGGDTGDHGIYGVPLESVFNILNGNEQKKYVSQGKEPGIPYPEETPMCYDNTFYQDIRQKLLVGLQQVLWEEEYINPLMELLEEILGGIPASSQEDGLSDISLYDHMKLTAACCSCIYAYLEEKQVKDYKSVLFYQEKEFWEEPAFALYSMDVSGIQGFIYTIRSEGALRNLRARSFYLELMMEHIIDTLLERLGLSRANLLYSGGGHCYLLLPNTGRAREAAQELEQELNTWMLDRFDISLYVASGFVPCSANGLRNEPSGSYAGIFRAMSDLISRKKTARYTADQIQALNRKNPEDMSRECKVCKRQDRILEDGVCPFCASLLQLSKEILYGEFFSVSNTSGDDVLPLPFGAYLMADSAGSLEKRVARDAGFLRAYRKNQTSVFRQKAFRLWVGSYSTGDTFVGLASQAEGIARVGILRADVDNLGKAFVSGFESGRHGDKYVTLLRTAAFSRQMSLFFKRYINTILENPEYTLNGRAKEARKAAVVYSGGDDLFLVGAWDDILEASVDIRQAFHKYTEGTLSLSAGIGLYQPKFPIHISAKETADLEEDAKMLPGKNAVTFLPDGSTHKVYDKESGDWYTIGDGTYCWEEFVDEVLLEKYQAVSGFFRHSEQHGKVFLYHLLELVRSREEKINVARYVYLLARMEPKEESSQEEKARYQAFSRKMYQWIRQEKDCRQLKTAMTIYAYQIRDKEEG